MTSALLSPTETVPAEEPHYSVVQIAKMWALSENMVRHMFEDYPGVLTLGVGKRKMLRIPASVLRRFHEERSHGLRAEVKRVRR